MNDLKNNVEVWFNGVSTEVPGAAFEGVGSSSQTDVGGPLEILFGPTTTNLVYEISAGAAVPAALFDCIFDSSAALTRTGPAGSTTLDFFSSGAMASGGTVNCGFTFSPSIFNTATIALSGLTSDTNERGGFASLIPADSGIASNKNLAYQDNSIAEPVTPLIPDFALLGGATIAPGTFDFTFNQANTITGMTTAPAKFTVTFVGINPDACNFGVNPTFTNLPDDAGIASAERILVGGVGPAVLCLVTVTLPAGTLVPFTATASYATAALPGAGVSAMLTVSDSDPTNNGFIGTATAGVVQYPFEADIITTVGTGDASLTPPGAITIVGAPATVTIAPTANSPIGIFLGTIVTHVPGEPLVTASTDATLSALIPVAGATNLPVDVGTGVSITGFWTDGVFSGTGSLTITYAASAAASIGVSATMQEAQTEGNTNNNAAGANNLAQFNVFSTPTGAALLEMSGESSGVLALFVGALIVFVVFFLILRKKQ
ncbi:Uncharacterised protein [uncultured archaeon]|nr:Uncharacterised protein [uncultured archaeon]